MKIIKNTFSFIIIVILFSVIFQEFGILNNTVFIEFLISISLLIITLKVYYKKFSFPLFPLYHFLLFVVYVFPVVYFNHLKDTWAFNTTALKSIYSEDLVIQVVLIFILVQITTLVQVLLAKKINLKPLKYSYRLKKNSSVIIIVFTLVFILLDMSINMNNLPLVTRQLFLLITEFLYIPIGILFFQYINNKSKKSRNMLLLLLSIYIIFLIGKAAAAPFAELALFIVVIIYHNKLKIHWSIYFAGVSFIAFIMNIKMSMRVFYKDNIHASVLEKITGIFDIFTNIFNSGTDVVQASLDFLLIRVQMLSTLMIVVKNTPQNVDYWGFTQLQNLFWSFIPRIVYPFKPILNEGQDFGHAYSIIGANDFVTAVNIPSLIGLYMSFGLVSLIVGIILFNFIMLKISQIAKKEYFNEVMIIALAYFSLNFIHNIDTGYTGLGSLFYRTILFYFVARFVYKKLLIRSVIEN